MAIEIKVRSYIKSISGRWPAQSGRRPLFWRGPFSGSHAVPDLPMLVLIVMAVLVPVSVRPDVVVVVDLAYLPVLALGPFA